MSNQTVEIKILIGLEIHLTLASQKKIFNWENTYQGEAIPNQQIGPWELGYLGVLPIINPEVVYLGLKLAAALGMEVSKFILFDRKIYNYFDLPKGYQITQQKLPLATHGYLPIVKENKKIPIKILQLEEDTAKSIYFSTGVKLDFNRSGNPLIELVTEPVFHEVAEVITFVKQLQNLLRYLDISEAKMEKGQLRVDLNFSCQLGVNYSSPRYEIKNLNSLANLEKAINYEINKHKGLFAQNKQPPSSQTLGFNESQQITITNREKTSYFYLPEVNIPPLKLKNSEIQKVKKTLPKLPWIFWQELEKFDSRIANEVSKNPHLMKLFNFLEKKGKRELKEGKNWTNFYLNYLSSHLDNNTELFIKKWTSYYSLFQYWKEKKLDNEEIKEIIEQLIKTKKNFTTLIKKYEKKVILDEQLITNLLEKLWNEELAKKLANNRQKVQNYLLGQIKRNYPNYPAKEIIIIVDKFLEKK